MLNKAGRKIVKRLRRNSGVERTRITGGKYQFVLCPLHDEKTASFSINLIHGNCRCFGCGYRGNIFNLVKENPSILRNPKNTCLRQSCKDVEKIPFK